MSKMLFPKMAVSNIRKNKKLYVPYIITAIFTVMMFFMNISIVKNKNVAAMRGGQNVVVLLQVALVVSFIFSAVFLFYTNSFLMKRRTKEIGLYNILGMEKKHISFMMLFEKCNNNNNIINSRYSVWYYIQQAYVSCAYEAD